QLHKLAHFRPPDGLGVVEFQRFSPYHRDPESFGIRLRPAQRYWHLYPLPEQELSRIAYHFDLSDGLIATLQTYYAGVQQVIQRWKLDHATSTLTWRTEGDEIVVCDRRRTFSRRDYRLKKHAIQVFLALDAPRGAEAAVREADRLARCAAPEDPADSSLVALRGRKLALVPVESASPPPWRIPRQPGSLTGFREEIIDFGRDAFAAEPKACLDWLAELGLLYSDDD